MRPDVQTAFKRAFKSYHDACGGAEVQLDDEAVPPGQEGRSGGRHQHVGVHGGGEIRLPSFR